MTVYSWISGTNGTWSTAADWSPAVVPDNTLAAVDIDKAPVSGAYTVTISPGQTQTVYGLSLNPVNNAPGTNVSPYSAAELAIDGTLVFSAGSPGLLAGPLQNLVLMTNGTIVNPGTLNAFIEAQGTDLLTGTNGIYITNWLQSLSGDVTVDTASIAELSGHTLFDGIFEVQGTNALINLGGPLEKLIVNIATIEGPPLNPTGWTEVYLDAPTDYVREWNGTTYVNLETTLTDIGARGTVDVLGGRTYATANILTVSAAGMLNLQAAVVDAAALDINSGIVQGSGTIGNAVVNDGSIIAIGGDLDIAGPITGTGAIGFDFDHKAGIFDATGAVLEVSTVAAGQTIVMNGNDVLKLDTPAAFAGTISAGVGDRILLGGIDATSAVLTGNTLTLSNGATVVDTLHLAGTYTGDTFTTTPVAAGTTLTVAGPQPNFTVANETTDTVTSATGVPYNGGPLGPKTEYANITPDSLYIASNTPSAFIQTGAGNDTINVSAANGNNVLDPGTGTNTLIGGTGDDTFYVNDVAPAAAINTLVENFHSGDYATIFGVFPSGFAVTAQTVVGPGNVNELQYTFSTADQPTATLTLVGYSFASITSGQITATYGSSNGTATGTPILNIHAT